MRPLKLFLAFALAWPISMGDKIVQLPQAEAGAYSSPWQMYRGLANAFLGTSYHDRQEGSSFQGHLEPVAPAILFPVAPAPTNALAAPGSVRVEPVIQPDFDVRRASRALSPPVPVFPAHLESKK